MVLSDRPAWQRGSGAQKVNHLMLDAVFRLVHLEAIDDEILAHISFLVADGPPHAI